MTRYRSLAALALLVILAHTHVTVLPGWTVPVIPLVLVSAAVALLGALWGVLRHAQRSPVRRYRYAPAGG